MWSGTHFNRFKEVSQLGFSIFQYNDRLLIINTYNNIPGSRRVPPLGLTNLLNQALPLLFQHVWRFIVPHNQFMRVQNYGTVSSPPRW